MSWPTDRRPSDALTGEFVPEIWSARVIEAVRSYLPCVDVVDVTWKDQLYKGDVLHIPVMTSLTASVVDTTVTAAINASNVQTTFGTTAESLTIDKWYEVPVQIDDSTRLQTNVASLLEKAADRGAYEIAKVMDTDVNSLFSTLNGSSVYGSDGQTFTDDILIYLMEDLDEDDVPREGRSLVGDPSMLADCYKIDKFMSMDYTNSPMGQMGGYRGKVNAYNLPVYITNNLTAATTGAYGALIHKEAIGLAIQDPMKVTKARVESAASDLIYVRAMWGADELRDTFGIAFYTRKK
jgi:hypothetical protein